MLEKNQVVCCSFIPGIVSKNYCLIATVIVCVIVATGQVCALLSRLRVLISSILVSRFTVFVLCNT